MEVEQTYSTPFLGYPYYSKQDELTYHPYYNDDCPPMRGMYRFHIPDPVYFEEDIRVTIQQIGMCHNGLFERQDDVSSVAYWYQEKSAAYPVPVPLRSRPSGADRRKAHPPADVPVPCVMARK